MTWFQCDPDFLLGEDEGGEVKCPSPKVHIANALGGIEDHFAQVQGALWITGRKRWHLISYHPTIPKVVRTMERDEAYIEALDFALANFVQSLQDARAKLLDMGATPAPCLDREFSSSLMMKVEDPWAVA